MPSTVISNGNTNPILKELTLLGVKGVVDNKDSNVYNVGRAECCGENKQDIYLNSSKL